MTDVDAALSRVRWNDDGLVAVVVQQWDTKEVLMMAWATADALRASATSVRGARGKAIELGLGSLDVAAEGFYEATEDGRRGFDRDLLTEHGPQRQLETAQRARDAQPWILPEVVGKIVVSAELGIDDARIGFQIEQAAEPKTQLR